MSTGAGGLTVSVEEMSFNTKKTLNECAIAFHSAVKKSYSPGRKLLRGASALRDDVGGLEFFTPTPSGPNAAGERPDLQLGAFVPGMSVWHGATRLEIHMYVLDRGDHREIHLMSPYQTGAGGSIGRLIRAVGENF
jgi:hypothetical protein